MLGVGKTSVLINLKKPPGERALKALFITCLLYTFYIIHAVISESSLITGGHAISKVRLIDEENEVSHTSVCVVESS